LIASIDGQSILLNIEDKRSAALARKAGFTLVQGDYFEQPITSANRNLSAFQAGKHLAAESIYY
jgi:EAL domain-containing protein (putative c-di-GMP-specific phosphodiesterase class I)